MQCMVHVHVCMGVNWSCGDGVLVGCNKCYHRQWYTCTGEGICQNILVAQESSLKWLINLIKWEDSSCKAFQG